MELIDIITLWMTLGFMAGFIMYAFSKDRYRHMNEASVILEGLMLMAFCPLLGYLIMGWIGVALGVALDVWFVRSSWHAVVRRQKMNKMAGFFALRDMGIPTVEWFEATPETDLDPSILWTVRTALLDQDEDDMSLPRRIGVSSDVARAFIRSKWNRYGRNALGTKLGMFVAYPYFHADCSGTLMIEGGEVTVEGCEGDLWNLVDDGKVDFRFEFLGTDDVDEVFDILCTAIHPHAAKDLVDSVPRIVSALREDVKLGHPILMEWSATRCVDREGNPMPEDPSLVFYEARVVA